MTWVWLTLRLVGRLPRQSGSFYHIKLRLVYIFGLLETTNREYLKLKTAGVVLQRVECGEGYTVAATTDGDLLLWGRRSKSSVGTDNCLAPMVSSDAVDTIDDTSRHLDICSPAQLTVEPFISKGHHRQPSNTSISSGTGADDSSAMKNAGIHSDHIYRAMHCSARHVVCLSVCLSVTLVDHDHIGWKSWKLIAQTISPTSRSS